MEKYTTEQLLKIAQIFKEKNEEVTEVTVELNYDSCGLPDLIYIQLEDDFFICLGYDVNWNEHIEITLYKQRERDGVPRERDGAPDGYRTHSIILEDNAKVNDIEIYQCLEEIAGNAQ